MLSATPGHAAGLNSACLGLSPTTQSRAGQACLCQKKLQKLPQALTMPVDSLPSRNSAYLALDDLTQCERRCLCPQKHLSGHSCVVPALHLHSAGAAVAHQQNKQGVDSLRCFVSGEQCHGDRLTQRTPASHPFSGYIQWSRARDGLSRCSALSTPQNWHFSAAKGSGALRTLATSLPPRQRQQNSVQ